MLLAFAALPLVVRLVPNALPIGEAPPLDLRMLAFAALMTLVTALGFGLAPGAARRWATAPPTALREGSRTRRGRPRAAALERWWSRRSPSRWCCWSRRGC